MIKRTAFVFTLAAFATNVAGAQTAATPKPAQPSTKPAAKPATKPGTQAHRPTTSKAAPPKLETDKQKASYAMGMNLAKNFQHDHVDLDPDLLVRGLKDTLAGGKTLMTEDDARAVLVQLQTSVREKQEQMRNEESAAAKQAGEQFLAANRSKEGVVELPSGLQYKILQQGTGPKPTADDTVVCNYRGTLINGQEFDSSYKRGEPATFPVNRVIKGWTEALQLMPVGSKWQLFIPSQLAYGERGAGNGDIPPNSTLVFEVELISIKDKQQP